MNKVVIFEDTSLLGLQGEINRFAKKNRIVNVSIATLKVGFSDYYVAAVLYEVE